MKPQPSRIFFALLSWTNMPTKLSDKRKTSPQLYYCKGDVLQCNFSVETDLRMHKKKLSFLLVIPSSTFQKDCRKFLPLQISNAAQEKE